MLNKSHQNTILTS